MTPRLVLATRSPGKIAELVPLLGDLDTRLTGLEESPGLALPPEGDTSYAENALAKARAAAGAMGVIALGDDSGLEVEALGGAPGVRSARYGGPGLSDAQRVAMLLAALMGAASRRARFRCVLALVAPWGEEALVEGIVEGILTDVPRGMAGFGYDPIFLLPALGRTFAELPPEEKGRWSHRARAVVEARPILTRWLAHHRQPT